MRPQPSIYPVMAMTVETVTLFLALLAVLAVVVTLAVAVSALTGDRFGLIAAIRPAAVEMAAAVSVTATVGSLYLSEGAGYDPCRLCWVQRGFMYPAAVLLAIAVFSRARWAMMAAGGLAAIGLPIAIFHRIDQASGGIGSVCDPVNPCSSRWVEHFGFVTIPTMAAAGFAAIVALVWLSLSGDHARS
jgi:disulfide bond formation protein DsbB